MSTERIQQTAKLRRDLSELVDGLDWEELSALQDCFTEVLSGVPPDVDAAIPEIDKVLNQDLITAAATMGPREARYNVDLFYQTQGIRKAAKEQGRSMDKGAQPIEPHLFLDYIHTNAARQERRIFQAMDVYSDQKAVGIWAKLNRGIGPVLAAGLMAHIDITRAPTVGHLWRFAGLDPTVEWLGTERGEEVVKEACGTRGWGSRAVTEDELALVANVVNRRMENIRNLAQDDAGKITPKSLAAAVAKRPYSANLKTLCWKIGESFKNFHKRDDCFYGHLYALRRDQERQWNLDGRFKEQAELKMSTPKGRPGPNTEAYKWYTDGKLPPSRIILRAQRWAVKIFLSHWQYVEYLDRYGVEPAKPYVLTLPGHDTAIAIPHWPLEDTGATDALAAAD